MIQAHAQRDFPIVRDFFPGWRESNLV